MKKFFLFQLLLFLSGIAFSQKTNVVLLNKDGSTLQANLERTISAVLTEFNQAHKANRKPKLESLNVTSEGQIRLQDIWKEASLYCDKATINEYIIQTKQTSSSEKGQQVRNIPLLRKGPDGVVRTESAVFNFNSAGLLEDLYFGVDYKDYKSLNWDESNLEEFGRRQQILNLLEDFKTAYNRKDHKLIGDFLSDKALIIVGKVVKQTELSDFGRLDQSKVVLTSLKKEEYLQNLRTVFDKNGFIDVKFDGIKITQHPRYPEIYGVNLKQSWKSPGYWDEGYLFVMIDFKDENKPVIHVRAWQPYEDTISKEVIEMGDIIIDRN